MCTMDYPKYIISNQNKQSISIQRVTLSQNYCDHSFSQSIPTGYDFMAIWRWFSLIWTYCSPSTFFQEHTNTLHNGETLNIYMKIFGVLFLLFF